MKFENKMKIVRSELISIRASSKIIRILIDHKIPSIRNQCCCRKKNKNRHCVEITKGELNKAEKEKQHSNDIQCLQKKNKKRKDLEFAQNK